MRLNLGVACTVLAVCFAAATMGCEKPNPPAKDGKTPPALPTPGPNTTDSK